MPIKFIKVLAYFVLAFFRWQDVAGHFNLGQNRLFSYIKVNSNFNLGSKGIQRYMSNK